MSESNTRTRSVRSRIIRRRDLNEFISNGNSAMRNGDYAEAQLLFEKAIELEASDELEKLVRRAQALALVKRAEAKLSRDDTVGAKLDLERSLWIQSTNEATELLAKINKQ